MADVMKLSNASSEIARFCKSRVVGSAADDGNRVFLIPIPRNGFVKGVFLNITTAYTGSSTGTVKVGIKTTDVDNDDYFMTDTEAASEVTGIKACPEGMQGFYAQKGGYITISFAKGDSAADVVCQVFADIATIY